MKTLHVSHSVKYCDIFWSLLQLSWGLKVAFYAYCAGNIHGQTRKNCNVEHKMSF